MPYGINELCGSGNDLSPVRHQVITWTNADLLWIRPQERRNLNQNKNVSSFQENTSENAFQNATCKVAAISSDLDVLARCIGEV